MKGLKSLALIGFLGLTVNNNAQVWLDLGYSGTFLGEEKLSVSDNTIDFEYNESFFRGVDAYLSWCDCSQIKIGLYTRKNTEVISFNPDSYFQQADFSALTFSGERKVSLKDTKREFRMPLEYQRRKSLYKNGYLLFGGGVQSQFSVFPGRFNSGYSTYNNDHTKEYNFGYVKNNNKSTLFKLEQLNVSASLGFEQYIPSVGAIYFNVGLQQSVMGAAKDDCIVTATNSLLDANKAVVNSSSYSNSVQTKRNSPNVTFQIGFKTCGFNLGAKKKKRYTNGGWPF